MRLQWLLCHKCSNDIANQRTDRGANDYTNDCQPDAVADNGSTDLRTNASSE
jgi:hypothetical protein